MEKMIEAVRGLKEFRKKWGLTQVYCARGVGVSLLTWNLWEKGVNMPNMANWEKLEKFLAFYEEE